MENSEKAVAKAAHGASAYIDAARGDRILLVELYGKTTTDVALQLFPVMVDIAAGLANNNPEIWEPMKASFRTDTEAAILDELDPDSAEG
jgi:hypothetical protein